MGLRRIVVALAVLGVLRGALGNPAFAADAKPKAPAHGVMRLVQRVRQKGAAFQAKLRDPAQRKLMEGNAALGLAGVAVGEGINLLLHAHGAPRLVSTPVVSTFLSSGVPTIASYYAQLGLSRKLGKYFAPPEKRSKLGVLADGAFAGTVGVVGGAALQLAGQKLDALRPTIGNDVGKHADQIALGVASSRRLATNALRGLTSAGMYVVKQASGQAISNAADRGRTMAIGFRDSLRAKVHEADDAR